MTDLEWLEERARLTYRAKARRAVTRKLDWCLFIVPIVLILWWW